MEKKGTIMELRGLVNVYHCETCKKDTATINLANGVTPFGINCPNCHSCKCYSRFYNLFLYEKIQVTHAWIRPATIPDNDLNWHTHLVQGGLMLKPLEEAETLKPDPLQTEDDIDKLKELYSV